MTGLLLLSLASLGPLTADVQSVSSATCTATAIGPTFGIGTGVMTFHFVTTCDAPVESITINASIDGPGTRDDSGTKTCTNTNTCTYLLSMFYARGTWIWTNDTTYTGGTDSATSTVTYNQ